MSSGGKITLLPDLAPAEHFAVLVHEVAHELLHRGDRQKETTHTVRETEAEAVAFVVCSGVGLDTNTSSSDYIQLHAGDKATLAESLAFIQQTSSVILQAIEPGGSTNLCDSFCDRPEANQGTCRLIGSLSQSRIY